jgi:hypothetical protein
MMKTYHKSKILSHDDEDNIRSRRYSYKTLSRVKTLPRRRRHLKNHADKKITKNRVKNIPRAKATDSCRVIEGLQLEVAMLEEDYYGI